MAIKVSGTSVINDSRQLQNIASIDSTTSSTLASALGGGASVQTFTSSGTWNKPSSGTVAMITCIGGGGGGARNNGNINSYSGGGTITVIYKLLSSLASSITVIIGAGGAMAHASSGGAGGHTKFGTDAIASGGNSAEGYWSGTWYTIQKPAETNVSLTNFNTGYIAGKSTVMHQTGYDGKLANGASDGIVDSGSTIVRAHSTLYSRAVSGHATGGYSGNYGGTQTPSGYGAGGTITHTGTGGSAGTSGFVSVIVF